MLYEDIDFKRLSDRYTNSRIAPFLIHIDGVRVKFIFNKSSAKNDPHYGKSTFFFHRKIGCNRHFSFKYGRGTTCLSENGPHHEKICLFVFFVFFLLLFFLWYVNNKGADQTAHPRSLISALMKTLKFAKLQYVFSGFRSRGHYRVTDEALLAETM